MLGGRTLAGAVVEPASLTDADTAQMYALLARHFAGYTEATFRRDLAEKDGVVVLREASGAIRGFSTFMFLATEVAGEPVRAVFSGDTIVDQDTWGQNALHVTWSRNMLDVASQIPEPLYWFLICAGYRPYRFLPAFFHEFHPRYDRPMDGLARTLIDAFGRLKFGSAYDAETGIVTLAEAPHLKDGVADATAERLRNPHVRFFCERNPGWRRGAELACITRISRENYKPRGLAMLEDREDGGGDDAR